MKYKVKIDPFYNFDHKKVYKHFKGNLTFCNEFVLNDNHYLPFAVYKSKTPNKKKGHKKYMLLSREENGRYFVTGMSAKEMTKHRYQNAIICLECNTLLYSTYRHHMNSCDCPNNAFADGGKDYLRCGAKSLSKIKHVKFDLITNKIIKGKK